MADINAFFNEFLPKKIADKPGLIADIDDTFQFDLGDHQWVVNLKEGFEGDRVTQGTIDDPGCKVTAKPGDFEKLLEKPASAMTMFIMGKLKVSNLSLGQQLQKLF